MHNHLRMEIFWWFHINIFMDVLDECEIVVDLFCSGANVVFDI